MTWQRRGMTKVWVGMADDDERHGTEAGYQTHRRHGERACLPCADAHAEASRAKKLKLQHPCLSCGKPARGTRCRACSAPIHAKAQNRAKNLLRLRHAEEYQALYDAALAEDFDTADDRAW